MFQDSTFILMILTATALMGCGGASQPDDSVSEKPPQPPVTITPSPSSKIASITNAHNYDFGQYKTITIDIDITQAQSFISGNYVVFKVYSATGDTYFSTIRMTSNRFSEQFSVPAHIKTLFIELYDEQQTPPYKQEIQL